MRILLSSILTIFCYTTFAQDFCKQIKKEVANENTFTYTAPYDTVGVAAVKIMRSYSTDSDLAFDNFVMSFQLVTDLQEFYTKNPAGEGENDAKTFTIEFDDKSKIENTAAPFTYEPVNENQTLIRGYAMQLEGADLTALSTKVMSRYVMSGYERKISSDSARAFKAYINCMQVVKK